MLENKGSPCGCVTIHCHETCTIPDQTYGVPGDQPRTAIAQPYRGRQHRVQISYGRGTSVYFCELFVEGEVRPIFANCLWFAFSPQSFCAKMSHKDFAKIGEPLGPQDRQQFTKQNRKWRASGHVTDVPPEGCHRQGTAGADSASVDV